MTYVMALFLMVMWDDLPFIGSHSPKSMRVERSAGDTIPLPVAWEAFAEEVHEWLGQVAPSATYWTLLRNRVIVSDDIFILYN